MKVTGFETHFVRVPYEEKMRHAPHIILRLRTDEGLEGVSYVTPLIEWSVKPIHAAVEAMAERVIGRDPMEAESINAAMLTRLTRPQHDGLARSAASLVDIALWDLKAQALGQPLWRLLGGSNNKVRTYASWNLWFHYDIDTLAQHGAEAVEKGFRAMKFRLGGVKTKEECLDRAEALREAVGPDVDLMVDMNWAWTVDKTIRIGRELEDYGLVWIEDPIPADQYDGLAAISGALETPICAGETYHRADQFNAALSRGAFDIAMIDLECGGITEWMKLASVVESYDIPVASHMCTEPSMHLIAARDGFIVEYIPWMVPLFKEVPPVVDGYIELSDKPGIGVELDMQAIKHFSAEN